MRSSTPIYIIYHHGDRVFKLFIQRDFSRFNVSWLWNKRFVTVSDTYRHEKTYRPTYKYMTCSNALKNKYFRCLELSLDPEAKPVSDSYRENMFEGGLLRLVLLWVQLFACY